MTERKAEQTRAFVFDLETREQGSDGIPVVISTEAVIEMPDGPEVLLHTADAIDLTRAPLPIIAGHGGGQINVGIIDNFQIGNGRLRGIAQFGARPEAAGYRADVVNRIIRSVSVGYARIRGKINSEGVLVTSRWMPTHAAMVAEPADVNAGFFRTRDTVPTFVLDEDEPPPPAAPSKGVITMSDETKSTPAAVITEPELQAKNPVVYEQERKQAIVNLVRANKLDERCAVDWITRGANMAQVSEGILQLLTEREKDIPSVATIGMEKKDVRRWSLMRAINASLNNDWSKAGLELDASQEVAKRSGQVARKNSSFFVPMEIQQRQIMQRDALVSGTAGYLVATENQGFIDMLRNRMVALQMGAQRLSGLVGNVTIPKQTAGATAYWLASETTAITEGNQTFAQLPLTPNTVGAYTQISRLLQLQSSPDAEAIIMRDLAAQVAIAVDLAVLAGTGTEQPTGITATASIGTVTGTSFTYASILEFQSDVASANALTSTCGYVTTPAIAALAMARPTFTNGVIAIWTGNMLDGSMGGFKAMSSMQVPTAGMLFGDWATVIIGEWGVLELATNPNDNFPQGLTGLRAFYTCDVGVKYAGAWSWGAAMT